MSLRWLWFDHIPPELEVPKEARRLVRNRARWLRNSNPSAFAPLWKIAITSLLPITIVVVTAVWIVLSEPSPGSLRPYLSFSAVPVIAVSNYLYYHAPFVRFALCQLGHLCCVKCAYPHIGLSKDVKECPECGTPREFGRCIHCKAEQDWPMQPDDRCTQCGRMRLS